MPAVLEKRVKGKAVGGTVSPQKAGLLTAKRQLIGTRLLDMAVFGKTNLPLFRTEKSGKVFLGLQQSRVFLPERQVIGTMLLKVPLGGSIGRVYKLIRRITP